MGTFNTCTENDELIIVHFKTGEASETQKTAQPIKDVPSMFKWLKFLDSDLIEHQTEELLQVLTGYQDIFTDKNIKLGCTGKQKM